MESFGSVDTPGEGRRGIALLLLVSLARIMLNLCEHLQATDSMLATQQADVGVHAMGCTQGTE